MFTNFNGQHRKTRNINLGGRNSAGPTNRESTLRRAQLERERRERDRREEKAALRIQSFVRSRFEVMRLRELTETEWIQSDYINSSLYGQSTPPPPPLTPNELNYCIVQFNFFFAWRYNGSAKNQDELTCLLDIIAINDLSAVPDHRLRLLLSSLSIVFQSHLITPFSPVCQLKALKILSIRSHLLSPEFAKVLGSYITSITPLDQSVLSLVSRISKVLASSFPLEYFNDFLSTPNLHNVSNDLLVLPMSTIARLVHEINNTQLVTNATPHKQVWQLVNFITLISLQKTSLEILSAINAVVSSLSVSIVGGRSTLSQPTADSDSDDDYISRRSRQQEQTQNNTTQVRISDAHILATIWRLYKQSFVTSVMDILLPVIDTYSDLLASLFVSLARLCPSKKQDLTLYISLVPTSQIPGNIPVALLLWKSFRNSLLYEQGSTQTLKTTDIDLFAREDSGSLIKLVFILELFSYWLIVTDDSEFHGNGSQAGLSLEEIRHLSTFLKSLAYSLIWNWSSISELTSLDGSFLTFEKIKSISVLVLRQIYIRDSRRQFLENGFWLVTKTFDMLTFIPIVIEEEKRRRELEQLQDDSDDEDSRSREAYNARNHSGIAGSSLSLLEILRQTPFFIPFVVRLRIFQAFVSLDRERSQSDGGLVLNMFGQLAKHKINIRRDHLLEDAFEGCDKLGKDFKNPIGVTFFNEYGPEQGIDGGGITKEFITSVCREAFQPLPDDEYDGSKSKLGLFSVTKDQLLYPNPILGVGSKFSKLSPEERREGLQYMKFLGKIIGKCLYEEILVDVEFALFFLQKWTGMTRNSFDDMYSLDPDVYSSLVKVHNYPGNVEEDLSLDFTVTQDVGHGNKATIPLVENGANRAVTNSTRLEYIHAVANYKLNTALHVQTSAFLQGMSTIVSLNWLSMFNGPELQMLISGGSAKINFQDLKDNCVLFEYRNSDDTMAYFWQVLEEFSNEDKHRFIKFVTSTPKAPLLGFGALRPKFAIRRAGNDPSRLPTASTCVNMIKLPNYANKRILREKLLTSIRADAGFDLS